MFDIKCKTFSLGIHAAFVRKGITNIIYFTKNRFKFFVLKNHKFGSTVLRITARSSFFLLRKVFTMSFFSLLKIYI